jgi:hypothetical protein
MSTTENFHSRSAIGKIFRILVWCPLLTCAAYGQAKQSQPEKLAYGADMANVPDAIAKVKSGDFAGINVDLLAKARAVEAIPALEEQFGRVQDPILKAKIAGGLVRLGDKDDTYWDFLVKLVTPAVDSDAPDFMTVDAQGKFSPEPSPQFVAWAKAHNLSPDSAAADSLYVLPGRVMLLGATGDPRAIPLLRQALSSPNHMIEIAAAKGLAELQDKESIALIIEACKRAPAEAASAMAQSLAYFDNPEAQSVVDHYVPTDVAKALRDARAQGKGPLSN